MKRLLALGATLLGLCSLAAPGFAQGSGSTSAAICIPISTTVNGTLVTTCAPVTATNPFPVTSTGGGIAANISQWGGGTLGAATAVGTPASGNVMTVNAQIVGNSGTPPTVIGNISNASSGVAVTTTNLGTVGYLYGFNGTTWDQLQVDGSKNLNVNLNGCSASTACNPNGQATMANSAPVVIASDQTSVHTTVDNFGTNPPAGFTPNGNLGTPLAVTGTSGRTALPSGLSVDLINIGSQPAYIRLGDTSVVATTSDLLIGGGQQICLTVGAAVDFAAISVNGNSKTTINSAGGTGACSGIGGSVTLNAPPNDVSAGPTTFTTTNLGTVAVSSQGSGSVGIQVTGAASSYTVNFEATIDNTNWFSTYCFTQSGTVVTSTTTIGNWVCPAGGYQQVRANLAVHASGTIAITVNASNGSTQHPVTTTGVSENLTGINGVAPSVSNGTSNTGDLRVNIASDNTAFAVNAQTTPVTSGGLSLYFVQPTASDNHVVIKNGAGQVYHVAVTNNSATINYLRLYNAGTGFNGCNSATNLVLQLAIPANSTNGAGFVEDISQGVAFATGISICVTSGYSQTDTTNATASAMSVNVGYK